MRMQGICAALCGIAIIKHWVSRQKSSPKNSLYIPCNPILSGICAQALVCLCALGIQAPMIQTKPSQSSIQTRNMYFLCSVKTFCVQRVHNNLFVHFCAPVCVYSIVCIQFCHANFIRPSFLNNTHLKVHLKNDSDWQRAIIWYNQIKSSYFNNKELMYTITLCYIFLEHDLYQ